MVRVEFGVRAEHALFWQQHTSSSPSSSCSASSRSGSIPSSSITFERQQHLSKKQ